MIVTFNGRLGVVKSQTKMNLLVEWFGGGKSRIKRQEATFINADDVAGFEHVVAFE